MPANLENSAVATGLENVNLQSQRKAMLKNAQTIIQLHSFHMLARLCSKSFKLSFSSIWIKNFQVYKLDSEKAEEPKINLPTFTGSQKKQGNSKKIYFCFIDYTKTFNCVDHNKLWEIHQEMGIPDHLTCLLRNLYAGQEATVRTRRCNNKLGPNWEGSMLRLYIITLLL